MNPSLATTLLWTERLIALATLLQTCELLQVHRAFRDEGRFSWPILRADHAELLRPLRWLFAALLPYRPFLALLGLRLVASAALLLTGLPGLAPLLLLSQIAICVRFRGAFNGGSDYMSVVILLGLSGAWASAHSPLLVKACLAYIAVQVVLSYWIAGVVKLRQIGWRRGEALRAFVSSGRYGTPAWLVRWLALPGVARVLSWSVLAFECGFPLALAGPRFALPLLAVGLSFHVGNSLVFGLNRFLFAWLAAYPALFYFSAQLAQS